jgi:glyoxylase-like metal-dependent hydrolase (beta-lactamase superfamily II)
VPFTIRLGASNVYLLPAGGEYLAIDAGPDYAGAWESAVGQMGEAGIPARSVARVLVTHGHPDHCALASYWQDRAGSQVWIAAGDLDKLAGGGRDTLSVRDRSLDFLASNGVPAELIAGARRGPSEQERRGKRSGGVDRLRNLRSVAPEHGEWPEPLRATPAVADRIIDAAQTIALGDRHLQPFLCPGHTPASTVFLDDATGDLYTGDHVLERIAPTPGIHFDQAGERIRSLPQYLRSLVAVRLLAPHRVLPGHGEPFTDLAGAVDRTTGIFVQRATRLLRRLRESPASAWELALRLYPHLRPAATWVVMAEIIGLLDLLEERGQIRLLAGEVKRFEAI